MKLLFRLVVLAVAGGLLVVLGLVVAPVLDDWLQDRETAQRQEALRGELREWEATVSPAAGTPEALPVKAGEPLGVLEIPRFGEDWNWVVIEGAGDEFVADGPAHYADTVLPGGRGSTGIAAHRAGHGDPFLDFDRLRVGDEVRFSQDGVTWVYRLTTAPRIIGIKDTWVLAPRGDGSEIALTTCWPKFGSSKRMYVHGELERVLDAPSGGEASD